MNKKEARNVLWHIIEAKGVEDINAEWWRDDKRSAGAGYDIFSDPNEFYNYYCDLGDCYELNFKDGTSHRINYSDDVESETLAVLVLDNFETLKMTRYTVPELGVVYKYTHTSECDEYHEITGDEAAAWEVFKKYAALAIDSQKEV